jgi:hypothetical protein
MPRAGKSFAAGARLTRVEPSSIARYDRGMRSLAALALLAACTAPNPDFVANRDLAPASGDLSGPVDLNGPMGTCGAGERKCATASASDICEKGVFILDRACPAGSACTDTYCSPPATMLPSQIGQRCDANGGAQEVQCSASLKAMLECQPFIDPDNHQVQWFCDTVVGNGVAGTACTKGAQCTSGFCGDNGTCVRACQKDLECKNGMTCKMVNIVVEGVRTQVGSCAP